MDPITQIDFSGGMSRFVDVTKTPRNMYRLGLNCRINQNGLQGAFRPRLVASPNLLHQTIFAADDQVVLMAAGTLYKLDSSLSSFTAIPTTTPLSTTADVIYHQAVPTPSNYRNAETGEYITRVSTFPEAYVLQDGVNRPMLLFSTLSNRPAKAFSQWEYENPEYVPIGKQMTSSGNVLYIADPTGRKIYRSVSGRQLDFVLDLNSDGTKHGDADTTNLAITTAELTALAPSQVGGVIVGTLDFLYEFVPLPEVPLVFDELFMQPRELFPVGVVNHLAFTSSNGKTLFVSPYGIQEFDQVAQTQTESSNSPFGAPIVDYITRPITRAATAAVGDYTLIAVETKFGGGILVYNNLYNAWESIDTTAVVKEFCVVQIAGLPRVFYITTGNECYELPLYTGTRRPFSVYLGDATTGEVVRPIMPKDLHLSFNDIRASGGVAMETFQDRSSKQIREKLLTSTRPSPLLYDNTPQHIPLQDDEPLKTLSFDISADERCYSAGVLVTCKADARLVSATLNIETSTANLARPFVNETAKEIIGVVGNIAADTVTTGVTTAAVTNGSSYIYYTPAAAATLNNGDSTLSTNAAGDSLYFKAKADRIFMHAAGRLMDFSTFNAIARKMQGYNKVILPGQLGGQSHFTPVERLLQQHAIVPEIVSGPADEVTPEVFFAEFQRPDYYLLETTHIDFYLFSIHLDTAEIAKDANGVLTGSTPAEITPTGAWANWLWGNINARLSLNKFNIVVFCLPPYIVGDNSPGWAALRWPFKRFGVHAVLSAYDQSYQRYSLDGVYYLNVGTGRPITAGTTLARRLQYPGHLKITATSAILQCEYLTAESGAEYTRDKFTIIA